MVTNQSPELFDLVAVTVPPSGQAVQAGDVGTVVELLPPDGVEVEFLDPDGRTRHVGSFPVRNVLTLNHCGESLATDPIGDTTLQSAGEDIPHSLKRQNQGMKSGGESFHTASKPSGFALLDYWRWAESDLLNNTRRAIVAEYLIARAVGAAGKPRVEWAGVDVVTPKGVRIEVKSSAYVQSWEQGGRLSVVEFDIAPRKSSWDPETNKEVMYDPPRRVADVYVFCVLGDESGSVPDPLDLADWRFYVVATSLLDRERPSGKTIGVRPLAALVRRATGLGAVRYDGLQEAIRRAAG